MIDVLKLELAAAQHNRNENMPHGTSELRSRHSDGSNGSARVDRWARRGAFVGISTTNSSESVIQPLSALEERWRKVRTTSPFAGSIVRVRRVWRVGKDLVDGLGDS